MDLVAVHALLPACNDLRLDALRFAPFPPLWSAAARQQICLIPALQIAVVILAERLRAGSVMAVEIPNPLEHLRSAGLHRLIFRDQKSPLLQVIAFNRPVVAVVAHRIVLQWSDPISEFVNMHSNDGGAPNAPLRRPSPSRPRWPHPVRPRRLHPRQGAAR